MRRLCDLGTSAMCANTVSTTPKMPDRLSVGKNTDSLPRPRLASWLVLWATRVLQDTASTLRDPFGTSNIYMLPRTSPSTRLPLPFDAPLVGFLYVLPVPHRFGATHSHRRPASTSKMAVATPRHVCTVRISKSR